MEILIIELIGIICIFIEWFVHKHTFIRDYNNSENWGNFTKISFPIDRLFAYIIMGLLPIANIIVFIVLAMLYLMKYIEEEGEFIFSLKDLSGQVCGYKPNRTLNKIKQWFNQDLNKR